MDGLHPLALNGLQFLLRIAWQASVLIVFVLVVQWVFRGRLSPGWRYGLWLLVLVRLALPLSLESHASVFNWVRVRTPSFTSPSSPPAASVALTRPVVQALSRNNPSAVPAPTAGKLFPANGKLVLGAPDAGASARVERMGYGGKILLALAVTWLLGALILSVRVFIESVRLQRMIAPKRLVTDSAVLELLEDCKQLMGVQAPVVLVQTECISSPVLYGFIRPRLLLPTGLLQQFSRAELRFVFLHELAHVRRYDIAFSWLMALLQVLHWFNPLVWLAFKRMKAERELACDALVLSHTPKDEQKAYGRTMVRLLEGLTRPARFPAMAGILEDPSQLATRIRCITNFNRQAPPPALALGLMFLLALVTLTDQRTEASTQPFTIWSARVVTARAGGDTDVRSVTLRPQAETDIPRALRQGGLCLAAETESTNLLKDGYRMIGVVDGLGGDHWQRCSRENTPAPRVAHSVVWTGRELLVWGGGARNLFKQTGAIYDPLTDTWRNITNDGAPSGRWQHAAQWTGKEMIVWGGRANFYPTNHFGDGARYNPDTDTWTRMNSDGAPAARSQMISVWTGKEFIVWGGRTDGGPNAYDQPLNDGARYNPETDSWTPMAAPPGLGKRYDATAVWTGRELIVWGGGARMGSNIQDQLPYVTYDTGARYDPVRDQWTLLPKEGAPRARYKHTAVWTGTEMLVWGGTTVADTTKSASLSFNDGAAFNPVTGRWRPISMSGAPVERSSHIAVWTGTEMLVWGGGTAKGECLNTGSRYDPRANRWTVLTVEGAPAPRFMMRPDGGIWTGKQFLVFGGYDLNTEFGTSHGWSPAPALHLYQRVR